MTQTHKPHFDVLDGLRGTAALMVVIYHIQGFPVLFDPKQVMLPHAYLAVDFFFALSGFVIGYAYDARWSGASRASNIEQPLTLMGFVKLRLIRLHPLVILGALLGFASYILDPFAGGTHAQDSSFSLVLAALTFTLLALPGPALAMRGPDTHALNGPIWTLLQEYVGNFFYAIGWRKLSNRTLFAIALLDALALLAIGSFYGVGMGIDPPLGSLNSGYERSALIWFGHSIPFSALLMGQIRMTYPFLMGLLLYRWREKLPKLQLGFVPLSFVLIIVLIVPLFPLWGHIQLNGLYDALVIILLFPLIVHAGAHSHAGKGVVRLCLWSGLLSYPLYITHVPFVYIWTNYALSYAPTGLASFMISTALLAFTCFVAWLAYRFWDMPLRNWLNKRA
jgi:peptidoglycan/LPS O-acetylase OafA/YrhL